MQKKSLEDLTEVFYPQVALPPLWQVIYHEAMRGHHLLFRKALVATPSGEAYLLEKEEQQDYLVQIVMEILNCPDLKSMSAIIDGLPMALYQKIYLVYLKLLDWSRDYVKQQLN